MQLIQTLEFCSNNNHNKLKWLYVQVRDANFVFSYIFVSFYEAILLVNLLEDFIFISHCTTIGG